MQEKRINVNELMNNIYDVLDCVVREHTVFIIYTEKFSSDNVKTFVLGPEEICGKVLGLVDPEYGWPDRIDIEDVHDAKDITPGGRCHPFIYDKGICVAVAISPEEYDTIKSKINEENNSFNTTPEHESINNNFDDLDFDQTIIASNLILEDQPSATADNLDDLDDNFNNFDDLDFDQTIIAPNLILEDQPSVTADNLDDLGDTVSNLNFNALDNDYDYNNFDDLGETDINSIGIVDLYILKEKLGAGGFGAVYLAEDTEAKILVALKVLPSIMSDIPEEMEKVRDNFALVSKLKHPNIAGLKYLHKIQRIDSRAGHALGVSTGGYLVVMEYVAGSTLSSWKKAQGGKIPFDQAVDICSKVAEALDYAHGHKIIHRDIKPSNIMVVFDNQGAVKDIKVLDFGLAAEIRSSMSRVSKEQGDTSGTRPYMAPEQWSGGKQGFFTDQYALAVMFYELVSGEVPFQSAFETGDPVIMLNVAENKAPEPLEELDKKQNGVLLKALSKEPEARFASCGDFVKALGGEKISHKGTKAQRKSGKGLKVFSGLLIAALLGFGAYISYTSYTSHELNQRKIQEQVLDAQKQAKVNELKSKIESAFSTGDLESAGAGIAELESIAGSDAASALRAKYESKAGEREVNKRSATAGVAYENAKKLYNTEGFDKKLEALEIDWRTAENARQGKTWGQAVSSYDTVLEKCKELQKLDGERTDANEAKKTCDNAKQQFVEMQQKLNPEDNSVAAKGKQAEAVYQKAVAAYNVGAAGENKFVESKTFWEQAATEYGTAKKYAESVQEYRIVKNNYENTVAGDLSLLNTHGGDKWKTVKAQAITGERSTNDPTVGIKSYKSALNGLATAVSEAKQLKAKAELDARVANVEKIIRTAQTANRSADSKKVFDLLSKLDTSPSEVGSESIRLTKEKKNLLEEANKNLIPSIKFTAVVDGKEVAATLKNSYQLWTTPKTFNLKVNGDYTFSAEYVVGKKRYKCKDFSITADWKGLREHQLDLQEVKGPTESETWTAELGNGVTMELLPVAAGSFMMGSNDSDADSDEKPVHRVTLTKPFWIGKYEVTQKQYEAVMGNNPSRLKLVNNPVENVSWNDAMEFCRKLTEKEHKSGHLPTGYRYTLPTEAQWEFAARGGENSKGYKYSGSDNLDSVGWYDNNSRNKTHPVGQKAPNELGLYDMSGNVWEWCSDWYGDYTSDSFGDPVGPISGTFRVFRGGNWLNYSVLCRLADRCGDSPSSSFSTLGFRLCLQTTSKGEKFLKK